jgi:hypothetical protein
MKLLKEAELTTRKKNERGRNASLAGAKEQRRTLYFFPQ